MQNVEIIYRSSKMPVKLLRRKWFFIYRKWGFHQVVPEKLNNRKLLHSGQKGEEGGRGQCGA